MALIVIEAVPPLLHVLSEVDLMRSPKASKGFLIVLAELGVLRHASVEPSEAVGGVHFLPGQNMVKVYKFIALHRPPLEAVSDRPMELNPLPRSLAVLYDHGLRLVGQCVRSHDSIYQLDKKV